MGEKEHSKVTVMVLKVDLQCEKCYKKVKKVLCKFPQIRDQIFDEKQNKVTITVICCSPEKIRDKLCCKGGGCIKSIEIVEPPKKKEPEKPKEAPPEKSKPPPVVEKPQQPKEPKKPSPKAHEPAQAPPPKGPAPHPPQHGCPPVVPRPGPGPVAFPVPTCCQECYEGVPGGPCYDGYGSQAPFIQYDGYCGRPVYDSWGCGPCVGPGGYNYSRAYPSRCEYINEENPAACTVM